MSMKKLLIKFLEPLDGFVFNYMVRAGLIKPFVSALIGTIGKAVIGGTVAKAIGGSSKSASQSVAEAIPERTAEEQLNDIVTIYFGPSAVGKYKGLYDPKLVSDLAKIDAKARKDLGVVELEQLDLLLNGTTRDNPDYQNAKNKNDAFRSIARKLNKHKKNSRNPDFIKSLTNGEAYYLYQEGLVDANKVPRKNYYLTTINGLISKSKKEINTTPKTIKTEGLNQIVKDQSELIGDITRSETSKTRTANVEDMERLGKAVTDAYRNADPASRQIADMASRRAMAGDPQSVRSKIDAFNSVQLKLLEAGGDPRNRGQFQNAFRSQAFRDSLTDGEAFYLYQAGYINADKTPRKSFDVIDFQKEVRNAGQELKTGSFRDSTDPINRLNQVGGELIGGDIREASEAEKALEAQGLLDINAPRSGLSMAASALERRGLMDINARLQEASDSERQLKRMGMSEGSLSPTEAESLIFDRGSEFIKSTGELSPLERLQATDDARQASVARGRGLDQSSLFDEMIARSSEQLKKKETEVELGAELLDTQAEMRRLRLVSGAGFLQDAEDLAAQRRLEQRQRQAMGIGALTTVDNIAARNEQLNLQRQQAGAGYLTTAAGLEGTRQNELLQRQQAGASMLNTGETIQSNRLNQAFDLNREMAPDLGNLFLGTKTPATAGSLGAARDIGSGAGYTVVDPNSGINMDAANYANRVDRAGAIASAGAADRAGSSSMMSDVTSAVLPTLFDNMFDTKMDFGY